MSARNRRESRPSLVLIGVLLVSLAIGAAASLLIGAATAPTSPPPRVTEFVLPDWLVTGVAFAVLLTLAGLYVYYRWTGVTIPVPNRIIVGLLSMFLVAILFLAALRILGGAGPSPSGGVPVGPGPPGSTGGNNSTVGNLSGTGGTSPLSFPGVPPWLVFVVVAGVAVAVAAIAVPLLRESARRRRERSLAEEDDAHRRAGAEARRVLSRAAEELDLGADPRTVIIALYSDLLVRLGPIVGDTEPQTPEEIRRHHLIRLGIRTEAANLLTRLFEEARYSKHPMGPDASQRARRAVGEARADLERVAKAP